MSGTKLSFSLKSQKKNKPSIATIASATGFEAPAEIVDESFINTDLPKEPLVIPVQKDARQSLQEQARLRRQQQDESKDQEDQAAIQALNSQAGNAENDEKEQSSKMVIQGTQNTFQRNVPTQEESENQQLQQDLEHLAPEISVDSQVYRKVPIADFGAALLRGMGWTGEVDKSDRDMNLPRPSRLGLGATPKLLDLPTHGRKPRRQDQVQREEQLKQQQEEYERKRLQQIKLDKQQTIQDGSIVFVRQDGSSRRGTIRKWQGVPGLNMTLVHFEGDTEPIKVKKGDIQLVERQELLKNPYQEPIYERKDDKVEYMGESEQTRDRSREQDRHRDKDSERRNHRHRDDKDDHSQRGYDRDDRDRGRYANERRSDDGDGRDKKRRHDEDRGDDRKRQRENVKPSRDATWLIPHIRVRIISTKLGKQYYKQKGVIVDVTRRGLATLTMSNGQVIEAPERYLETALPKVGGSACILSGKHRLLKGRLLERDSEANRGTVQVFEDMNIVITSLDDMAEWCGPLDDDLME